MTDIKLNKEGDLDILEGSLTLTDEIAEETAQRLKIKLGTYLSEWYLDLDVGLPYFETIFIKSTSKDIVDTLFRSTILNDPEIRKINSFTSTIKDRVYNMSFEAEANTGQNIILTEQIIF